MSRVPRPLNLATAPCRLNGRASARLRTKHHLKRAFVRYGSLNEIKTAFAAHDEPKIWYNTPHLSRKRISSDGTDRRNIGISPLSSDIQASGCRERHCFCSMSRTISRHSSACSWSRWNSPFMNISKIFACICSGDVISYAMSHLNRVERSDL